MSPLDLILIALATWRLSLMLVEEDGLFMVFAKLRTLPYPLGSTLERTGILDCLNCTSVYAAAAMIGLWIVGYAGGVIVALLAVSGIALLVDRVHAIIVARVMSNG